MPRAPQRVIQSRERAERVRQVRALALLALAVLLFAIIRFGLHRVFTQGWWRLW